MDSGGRQLLPRDGKGLSSGQQQDDKSSLLAAVNNVSSYVQNISREVHIYVDDSGGDTMVTVVDSRSGRTIRQVPPYEIISISRQISAHRSDPIKGLLFKSEA